MLFYLVVTLRWVRSVGALSGIPPQLRGLERGAEVALELPLALLHRLRPQGQHRGRRAVPLPALPHQLLLRLLPASAGDEEPARAAVVPAAYGAAGLPAVEERPLQPVRRLHHAASDAAAKRSRRPTEARGVAAALATGTAATAAATTS